MRTVKTKKELIKAIEDGERTIKVDSKRLYAACKLAEKYDSVKTLLKHYVFTKLTDVPKKWGAVNLERDAVVTIAITISVLITTIAIIGILNDKKVKIKCKGCGLDGEVEIG